MNNFRDAPNLQGEGVPRYELYETVLNVAAIANPLKKIVGKGQLKDKEGLNDHLYLLTLSEKVDNHWPHFEVSESGTVK